MSSFTGTQQKCKACEKKVYHVELLSAYHKSCFKCSHCKSRLQLSRYSSMEGELYCKPHYEQLFKESGSFTKNFQSSNTNPCIEAIALRIDYGGLKTMSQCEPFLIARKPERRSYAIEHRTKNERDVESFQFHRVRVGRKRGLKRPCSYFPESAQT